MTRLQWKTPPPVWLRSAVWKADFTNSWPSSDASAPGRFGGFSGAVWKGHRQQLLHLLKLTLWHICKIFTDGVFCWLVCFLHSVWDATCFWTSTPIGWGLIFETSDQELFRPNLGRQGTFRAPVRRQSKALEFLGRGKNAIDLPSDLPEQISHIIPSELEDSEKKKSPETTQPGILYTFHFLIRVSRSILKLFAFSSTFRSSQRLTVSWAEGETPTRHSVSAERPKILHVQSGVCNILQPKSSCFFW